MKQLFFIISFLFVAFCSQAQFRLAVNGVPSWTNLGGGLYSATVTFHADLTGNSYAVAGIVDTMRLFTSRGQVFEVDSVWGKTFSQATLRVTYVSGVNSAPVGQGMVYAPNANGFVPDLPFGSTGATAQFNQMPVTYNASLSVTNEPAGSNTEIQYNNSAAFGASSFLTYNPDTSLTIGNVKVWNGTKSVSSNVGVGANTLAANTTGNDNIAIGQNSLSSNTTGSANTATGRNSLVNNITGAQNTANGYQALLNNTTGSNNNATGYSSLLNNTTGTQNVGNGYEALFHNTTGSNNIAIGDNSGRYIADGISANAITNNSVYLGSSTKALANNQTNQIVIGHGATGLGDSTAVLGAAMKKVRLGNNLTFKTDQSIGAGQDNYVLTYDHAVGTVSLEASASGADGNGIYSGDGTAPADVDVTVTDSINFDAGTLFLNGVNNRIGIGTVSPERTLHVSGEARITDLTTDTPTRIVGADADGDLGAITVGSGLNLSGGTLTASNSANNIYNSVFNYAISSGTGYAIIQTDIPFSTANFFTVTIEGNDFGQSGGSKQTISFYCTGSVFSAVSWSGTASAQYAVQLGVSGGNVAIILGASGTAWNYANIGVPRLTVRTIGGYSGPGAWTGSVNSSIASYTNVTAVTNNTLIRSANTADQYFSAANVGFGNSAPTERVHVTGNVKATGTVEVGTLGSTATSVSGRDSGGKLTSVTVGSGLNLSGGTLTATGGVAEDSLVVGHVPYVSAANTIQTDPAGDADAMAYDNSLNILTVKRIKLKGGSGTTTELLGRNTSDYNVNGISVGANLTLSSNILSAKDTVFISLIAAKPGVAVTQTAGHDYYDATFLVPEYLNGFDLARVDYAMTNSTATTGSWTVGIRLMSTTNTNVSSNGCSATFNAGSVRASSGSGLSVSKNQWLYVETHPSIAGTLDGTNEGLLATMMFVK